MLPPSTTQHLGSISPDGSTFTFSQLTSDLEALSVGDVIAGDVSDQAANGFLRKIQAITPAGEGMILETEAATLEDAVEQGAVQATRVLTPSDVSGTVFAEGVTQSATLSGHEPLPFVLVLDDVVLYDVDGDPDTTDDQVVASGGLTIEPSFDFALNLRHSELEELRFVSQTSETVEIRIEGCWGTDLIAAEVEVARYAFTPMTVWIGAFPVVIVPELTVTVGLNGTVESTVTTGVTQHAVLSSGLSYKSGSWEPIWSLTNDFVFDPPTVDLTIQFRGQAPGRLTLSLYGIAGPYAEVVPYLELDADNLSIPWWTLYGGVEVNVGVDTDLLSDIVESVDQEVIDYRLLLTQASSACSGSVVLLVPPNGGILTPQNPYVSWTCTGQVSSDASWLDLQVATDPSFSHTVAEPYAQPSCITWDLDIVNSWALPAGTYYWRAALLCGPGWPPPGPTSHVRGLWSEIRNFIVQRP